MQSILPNLLSAEEARRKVAESTFEMALKSNPVATVESVLVPGITNAGAPPGVRKLAFVLLRRVVKSPAYSTFPPQAKQTIIRTLMLFIEGGGQDCSTPQEREEERRAAVHCLVSVPAMELYAVRQDVVMLGLAHINKRQDPSVGLFLLDKLAEFVPPAVEDYAEAITDAVVGAARDQQLPPRVRLIACLTASSLILSEREEEEEEDEEDDEDDGGGAELAAGEGDLKFKRLGESFLGLALPVAAHGLTSPSEAERTEAERVLQSLHELVQTKSWIFGATMGPMVDYLLQIAEANIPAGRATAMAVLGVMFQKKGNTILKGNETLAARCLRAAVRLQVEDEEFPEELDVEEEGSAPLEEDPLSVSASSSGQRGAGLSALTEMCLANSHAVRDAKGMQALVFQAVQPLLGSGKWIERYAGLSTIAAVALPLEKAFVGALSEVVPGVCRLAEGDSDARVRFAALCALKCILDSEILARAVKKNSALHSVLVPTVLRCIMAASTASPAKRGMLACAGLYALSSLFAEAGSAASGVEEGDAATELKEAEAGAMAKLNRRVAAKHVQDLVSVLIGCVEAFASFPAVQSKALGTLGFVVSACPPEAMTKLYDALLPGLKNVFATASDPELSCAAMACLASVAETVGKDRFVLDANEILSSFFQRQAAREHQRANGNVGMATTTNGSEKRDESHELEGLFEFVRRVAAVLQGEFAPFVPYVLPLTLRSAAADLGFQVTEADGNENDGSSNNNNNPAGGEDGTDTAKVTARGIGSLNVTANVYAYQLRSSSIRALDAICDHVKGQLSLEDIEACAAAVIPNIADRSCTSALNAAAAEAAGSIFFAAVVACNSAKERLTPAQYGEMQARVVRLLVSLATPLLLGLAYQSTSPLEDTEMDRRDAYSEAFERQMRVCYYSGSITAEGGEEEATHREPTVVPPLEICEKMMDVVIKALEDSLTRRRGAAKMLHELDFEGSAVAEFEADVITAERDFSEQLVDALGFLLKTNPSGVWGPWKAKVLPFFLPRALLSRHVASLRAEGGGGAGDKRGKGKGGKAGRKKQGGRGEGWISAGVLKDKGPVHNSLCVFVDSVEQFPEGVDSTDTLKQLVEVTLPALGEALADPDPLLKQVAAFGLGVCARRAPGPWMEAAGTALATTLPALDKEDDEFNCVIDNTVATLGKIGVALNRDDWIGMWLEGLPLKADYIEAPIAIGALCDLVQQGRAGVVSRPVQVLSALGKVLKTKEAASAPHDAPQPVNEEGDDDEEEDEPVIDDETLSKVPSALRALRSATGEAAFLQALQSVSDAKSRDLVMRVM